MAALEVHFQQHTGALHVSNMYTGRPVVDLPALCMLQVHRLPMVVTVSLRHYLALKAAVLHIVQQHTAVDRLCWQLHRGSASGAVRSAVAALL
jgi:hypothetical protein